MVVNNNFMNYKSFLNELILTLVKEQGSDLHLVVGSVPILRINGELINLIKVQELTAEDTVEILRAMVVERIFNNFVVKQELDFAYEHLGEYRLRCNAYFQKGLVGITLRLVSKLKTFSELNLPSILKDIASAKQGFFLVTGPVRQGKSTTLAAIINEINVNARKHIITIEDPIEYIYKPDKSIIAQREIGRDTNNFHVAIRESFRQDVDVILVGEMRDLETISAAVTAAETGHLIFSTLHTNSASQTINRIIDIFPANEQAQIRLQLASSLLGIFSQRLIPSVSGNMIPVYELLINNSAVANLIRDNRINEIDLMIETGKEYGMIDFNRNLSDLVKTGKITLETAVAYAHNPRALQKMF